MGQCPFQLQKHQKDCIKEVKEKLANKIKQYRFYASNDTKNQPTGADMKSFSNGQIFQATTPITQLGVQALPGTKFYLNEGIEPVIIGSTGIYELDLNNATEISALSFDWSSLQTIASNPSAFLIVDILYDDGEEG